MAQLTQERLKEMEEEMSRFEEEILHPSAHHLIPPDGQEGREIEGGKQVLLPTPMANHMQFIPHQVQRFQPPPRSSMRPMFMGRGPHPQMMQGPFPPPPMMGPPMGMGGPPHHGFGGNFMPQPVYPNNMQSPVPSSPTEQHSTIVAAPTVYAAPPMKMEPRPEPEPAPVEVASEQPMPVVKEMIIINRPKEPISISSMDEHLRKKENKKKKMVRMAGNQVWEDNSLLDWEYDDFRIFCGDLGNDVTDEILTRAFCKFPSFVKAKVVRDKRTNKTKGFGFVSYKDPQDFIKAMREMNGKYVGSRPIKLRKSSWKDRNIENVKKKQKEKEKLGLL